MANGSPNIASVVRSLGSGQKASATGLINEIGYANAAVLSKLRRAPAFADTAKNDRETANVVNYAELKQVSGFIGKKKVDSENITKLFPDVELAKQIYISSVIAPKDMTSTEILYRTDDPVFPADLIISANECIKRNVEGYYGLDKELQSILKESLFEVGSYVVAVLPESSIDEVINNDKTLSMESASPLMDSERNIKGLGFLGDFENSGDLALENFFNGGINLPKLKTNAIMPDNFDIHVQVYDNYEMLKMPLLNAAISAEMTKNILKRRVSNVRPAMESGGLKEFTSSEIRNSVMKSASTANEPIVSVKTKENTARRSIGRALRMKLPSESVIPVYAPGQPEKHIGYFILLDINGAPLCIDSERQYNDGVSNMMNNNTSNNQSSGLSSFLLKKAKDTLVGTVREPSVTDMARVYSSIIEKELVSKLKKGLYRKDLEIGDSEEIYRMMLFRSLQGQQTRMLYVPAELITYYANEYHSNGVGKSLMDDLTMLISTRATVMIARVMQQIRSSINVTNVGVTLDDADPDPEKTMEMTVANVMKYLQFQMPIGLITQSDLYEWVSRAGVRFSFDGHPSLPNLKYDFTNDTIGNTIPDTDLDEDLRRRTYMAFGLSPEQVDNSLSPDFATSVLANNALLSKRVMNTQDKYTTLMTDDARRIMNNDMIAHNELREIIKVNLGKIKARIKDTDRFNNSELDENDFIQELTERYISSVELTLPRPDLTTIDNQMEAMEKAEGIFDKMLESHVSQEAFPEMVSGNLTSKIDELKGIFKAAMMRQWLSNNPSFKELNDIIERSVDKDGKTTIFDITKIHANGFVTSMLKFMKEAKPFAMAASRDVDNIENMMDPPEEEAPNDDLNNDAPVDGTDTTDENDNAAAGPDADNADEDKPKGPDADGFGF